MSVILFWASVIIAGCLLSILWNSLGVVLWNVQYDLEVKRGKKLDDQLEELMRRERIADAIIKWVKWMEAREISDHWERLHRP